MRHSLALQDAILTTGPDAYAVAAAMEEREPWAQPLRPEGERLYRRLVTSLGRSDASILHAMRQDPESTAAVFALLPARQSLELFGLVEGLDEHLLGTIESRVQSRTLAGRLMAARVGFLRAVHAMSRIVGRTKDVAARRYGPQM